MPIIAGELPGDGGMQNLRGMLRLMLQDAGEMARGVRGSVVAIWLAVQLVALAVPLWARAPATGEHALHVMLAVQLVALALLFPFLLSGWASAAAVALLALPFIQFSGMVAMMPLAAQARAAVHLMAWIVALALLSAGLGTAFQRLWAVAVVSGGVMGSAILEYFRMERLVGDGGGGFRALLASLQFATGLSPLSLTSAGALAAVALLMLAIQRRRRDRARQLIHTSSTSS